jgi:hypothetical protein
LPTDITSVGDVQLRQLYWQRHSLYAYARWFHARVSNALSDAQRELDVFVSDKVIGWRDTDKDTSNTELKQRAQAEEKAKELAWEVHENTIVAGEVRSLQDWYSLDCETLSRELTARKMEQYSPGPYSKS